MKIAAKNRGLLAIVVAAFFFTQCGSPKKEPAYALTSNTPFTIGYATVQLWDLGVKGRGSGITVVLNFDAINTGVEFQNIYFKGQRSKVKHPEFKRIVARFKSKGNRTFIMHSDPVKEAANLPPAAFPFKGMEAEAILSYRYNGKTSYTKVGALIEEKTVSYPLSPPGGRN